MKIFYITSDAIGHHSLKNDVNSQEYAGNSSKDEQLMLSRCILVNADVLEYCVYYNKQKLKTLIPVSAITMCS